MKVLQDIPDGALCGIRSRDSTEGMNCIFLDAAMDPSYARSGLACRRHTDFRLATEEHETGQRIHKCPPCLKQIPTVAMPPDSDGGCDGEGK